MVDLYGSAGLLSEAKKVIDDMPMEPDVGVLGALLSTAGRWEDVARVRRLMPDGRAEREQGTGQKPVNLVA